MNERGEIVLRDPPDALDEAVQAARAAVLRHPVAAQAAFAALVAEGRRFAATDEGRAWLERLAPSLLVQKGRLVFETATLNLLTDEPTGPLPSQLLDVMMMALSLGDLEPRLSAMSEPGRR